MNSNALYGSEWSFWRIQIFKEESASSILSTNVCLHLIFERHPIRVFVSRQGFPNSRFKLFRLSFVLRLEFLWSDWFHLCWVDHSCCQWCYVHIDIFLNGSSIHLGSYLLLLFTWSGAQVSNCLQHQLLLNVHVSMDWRSLSFTSSYYKLY